MSAILVGHELVLERVGRRILDAVTVTLAPGTLTAVVGPNGSGKSTLLRVLGGLWQPTGGEVTLNDAPLARMPRREISQHVSFLPQDTRCDFAFTVEEMVAMGRHPHRGRFAPKDAHDRKAVRDALETCDLNHLRTRTITRLSGGERQRVTIARCLATESDILLLDEPTAHLDLEHVLSILTLSRRLADRGKAIALATHDLGMVARYATEAVLLRAGRAVVSGPPAHVLTPDTCRDVFAVNTEVLSTASGAPVFVFSMPTHAPEPVPRQGAHG